ncbi:unnamed protein product [Brassica oleracea]
MSHNDTTSLYQSSQSDIDEIENMINNDGSVLPARPSIPVTSSPFVQSNLPTLPQDTDPKLSPFRTLTDA